MRVGDWRRGGSIARQNRRLIIEWWSPRIARYRVIRFGPLELHRGAPF